MKVEKEKILYRESIPGGFNFSTIIKRGQSLLLRDVAGGLNVNAMFFNPRESSERYNMPDTLKAQFISALTKGNVIYSDMGRVMLSITDDSLGWHDTIGGLSRREEVMSQYPINTYQNKHNDYTRLAYDSLMNELGKYDLGARDFISNVSFFSRVEVNEDGAMTFVENHSPAGSYVNLQAEMDVLVLLNTCPHAMDKRKEYIPGDLELTVWESAIVEKENPCYHFCEQNIRGFTNTRRYLGLRSP